MIVLYGVVLCCMDLIISNSGNDLSHLYGHGKCLDVPTIYIYIIPHSHFKICYKHTNYALSTSRHISIKCFCAVLFALMQF